MTQAVAHNIAKREISFIHPQFAFSYVAGRRSLVEKSSLVVTALLSIFIIVTPSVCMVHAALVGDAYFSVAPPLYTANVLGEIFIVEINISNVQNLRVFEFKLEYNATLLDVVEVVQGPFFPPPPRASVEKLETNRIMGFVWVRISLSESEPTIDGSGTLAAVTFNATFAPVVPEKASCTLHLYDTSLKDGSMMAIPHDITDGLYFWRSVQADPPANGRLIDLSTQKGGMGSGGFGGIFTIGETVELYANITYNGYPVGAKLVAFEVQNPNGTSLAQVAFTNSDGLATINFSIPFTSEIIGGWTAFATAQVADEVIWDFLLFDVIGMPPPHGPIANFTEVPEAPYVDQSVYFDASTSQPGFDGDDECPITEYRWNFGDGNETTTTVSHVYHTYLNAGIYYVMLTVYAPGIPPYIDPQYNDTNTTYPPEKKLVHTVPVGGYSQPVEKYTGTTPMMPYFILSAMLTPSFAVVRRKKPKKR